MQNGYISLHRKIQKNWLWPRNRAYTKLEAWLDLLLSAAWQDWEKDVFVKKDGKQKVSLKRGQVFITERYLAKRWNWKRGKVQRFLKRLEKEGQIEMEKVFQQELLMGQIGTTLTISNYEKYQNSAQNRSTNRSTLSVDRQGLAGEGEPLTVPYKNKLYKEAAGVTVKAPKQNTKVVFEDERLVISESFHKALKRAFPGIDLIAEYKAISAKLAGTKETLRNPSAYVFHWMQNVARRYKSQVDEAEYKDINEL